MKKIMWHPSSASWLSQREILCQLILVRTQTDTLEQKPTFYSEIPKNLMFEKCEFCEKWNFENVNFAKNPKNDKCKFCEKWDFENVNFVKNEISTLWIFG